jgi:hypothetical protein
LAADQTATVLAHAKELFEEELNLRERLDGMIDRKVKQLMQVKAMKQMLRQTSALREDEPPKRIAVASPPAMHNLQIEQKSLHYIRPLHEGRESSSSNENASPKARSTDVVLGAGEAMRGSCGSRHSQWRCPVDCRVKPIFGMIAGRGADQ